MKECVAVAHPMLDKALLPPQETALSLQETPLLLMNSSSKSHRPVVLQGETDGLSHMRR